MKFFSLLLVVFTTACCTSNPPEENVQKPVDYRYVAYYIQKRYVQPSERRRVDLERDLYHMQNKVKIADHERRPPEKIVEKMKEIKKELEVIRLWSLYYEKYTLHGSSVEVGDEEKADQCRKLIEKIKAQYKKITDKDFPDVEEEFRTQYGNR